jgi:phosphohistidine phosphatase
MKLYFLRHGEADWPNWDRPDDARPLTKKGKKQMRRVAKSFEQLKVAPNVILSSPLPRAMQTAEIAAQELGLRARAEPALKPDLNLDKLAPLLKKYAGKDVMIVGHEPSFSALIGLMTGGNVKLAKAGIARVDMDDPAQMQGVLVWLVPPKFMSKRG